MSWGAIPPALLLIILAWGARRWFGSWIAPGALFALAWAGLTWAALLIAPDFHVWPVAIWVIAVGVVLVALGQVIGASLVAGDDPVAPERPSLQALPFLSLAGAAAGSIAVLYLLRSQGQGLGLLVSPGALGAFAAKISSARYEEGYVEPLLTRVLMTGTYFAALTGGCSVGLGIVAARRPASWGGFVPAVTMSAVTTTRATVLFCLVLWIGGYLAGGRHQQRDFGRLFTVKSLLAGGVGLPLLVIGAGAIQLSRYGMGVDGILFVADRLRLWIVGFLAGFASWLGSGAATGLGTSAGAFTFAGVYSLAGVTTRSLGLYADLITIGDGYEVNIYTIFRSVLQDFGIVGGALALLLFGVIGGMAYANVARGRLGWLPALAMTYALILFSHITSLFNYNSIVLAWVCCLVLVPAAQAWGHLAPAPRHP